MRALILAFAAAAALSACASSRQERDATVPDTSIPAPGLSSLTLIPTDNPTFAYRALTERTPSALGVRGANEAGVHEACNAREPRTPAKESPTAVLAPGPNLPALWQAALADARVGAAMRRHSTVYAQSARRQFYGDPEGRTLEPAWRCFRFTRFSNRDDAEPALDFVGQLRLGDSGDYLQLRALRLFAGAAAEERRLAIGLRIEAVWRQGNIGRRETVFEPVLLALQLKPGTEEVRYFLDKYWEHYPVLPLVPVSVDTRGRQMQTAPATVTVTAVEIREAGAAEQSLLRPARSAGDQLGALIAAALTAR